MLLLSIALILPGPAIEGPMRPVDCLPIQRLCQEVEMDVPASVSARRSLGAGSVLLKVRVQPQADSRSSKRSTPCISPAYSSRCGGSSCVMVAFMTTSASLPCSSVLSQRSRTRLPARRSISASASHVTSCSGSVMAAHTRSIECGSVRSKRRRWAPFCVSTTPSAELPVVRE